MVESERGWRLVWRALCLVLVSVVVGAGLWIWYHAPEYLYIDARKREMFGLGME